MSSSKYFQQQHNHDDNDQYVNSENESLFTRTKLSGEKLWKNFLVQSHANRLTTIESSTLLIVLTSTGLILCSIFLLLVWKRMRKRARKIRELKYLTPKMEGNLSPSTARVALGIKPDQPIEFVVPTITLPGTSHWSMTEDSYTDSDYYPGSPSERDYLPASIKARQRHLTGQLTSSNYLSVGDFNKAYYDIDEMAIQPKGKVNFVLHYSVHRQQLLITLLSATDLPPSKKDSISPFAKICLLPDKNLKFVTKIHRNNRNPVFNEMFIFFARKATIDDRKLRISIWDSHRFSRKFFIGQVVYNLSEAGIKSSMTNDVITDEILCPLSPSKSTSLTGEISITLHFDPNIATLTVTINKARGLIYKDISTVYIKVTLYAGKKRIGSKKSTIRKAHPTIEFNDRFHVYVKDTTIDNVNVVITLIGRSIGLNAKHTLGKVYIGDNSCSDGSNHWQEMLKEKGSSVQKWHAIS